MYVYKYEYLKSILIINCAELWLLAAENNCLMPRFKPNYSLHAPIFFFHKKKKEWSASTCLSPQITVKLLFLSYLSSTVFLSLLFSLFLLEGVSICPCRSEKASVLSHCLSAGEREGWMARWVDGWKEDGVSWRDWGDGEGGTDRQPSPTSALSARVALVYIC